MISCKDDDEPTVNTFPTESISLSPETNSLIMLEYSSTSSQAAQSDLIRANLESQFPVNIVHFSLPSNTADPLYSNWADSLSDHFGGKPAFTFLLNGSAKTIAEVQASVDAISDNVNTKPLLSVGHKSFTNDTSWVVDVKVGFFKDTVSPFLYIETYFLADIVATSYDGGALDLKLRPNSALVSNVGETTEWLKDTWSLDTTTLLFPAASAYVHKRVFLGNYNSENVFGTNLSTYSKFGAEFFNGDNIGLRQNPIRHYFLKSDYDHLDFTFTPRFVTVVWNYDFIDQEYEYVNSYMD